MKLRELLKDVTYELVQGNLDIEISDITYKSNDIGEDFAFVALKGFRVDGHNYIEDALKKGAKCIILEDNVDIADDVTVVKLEDTRVDLSKISRTLFDYPDKEITTIAITGTKGKTTTSSMIRRVLNDNGMECGLIGTMGVFYKDKYYHTVNTSPESYDVFKYMREMLDNDVRYLVMEVSSQSLKLKRWSNVVFDYAVFTNLSLDHVGDDEHDSFHDYMYCKSLLFKQCGVGLFNADSEYCSYMSNNCSGEVYTFGTSDMASYRLVSTKNIIDNGFMGIEMVTDGVVSDNFRVSIPGNFTAYNALCCISICSMIGVSISGIKKSLENIFVKGRLEPVRISNKFSLLIDYAYQGIAMENILTTIKESNPKRIVTIFGCGGNRSRQRRYDCGEISGKYADLSILTADNPRYEKNEDIIKDILVGMDKTSGKYIIINDRKEAIKYAILNAIDGDVILLLGKGHEDYQEIEGVRYPFDERIIIREIIGEMTAEEKEKAGIVL